MNKSDSERTSFYLESLGFKVEKDFLKARLVLIVTCGVRQSAEDRVYGLVNQILKKNKKVIIAITGCLSDRPDVKKALVNKVAIYFNISDLLNLDKKLFKYFSKIKAIKFSQKNYLQLDSNRFSNFSAFVPIGNGCNNFCSYCVVPYARGREVYRPAQEIIKEVKDLIKSGYKEINLIAQNVNSYKSSIDFPGLLSEIDNIKGKFWLRFSTSHPKDVNSKLLKVFKTSKNICEHFHLALQSGDNDILQSMNRKYSSDYFKKLIIKIRKYLDYKNGFPVNISTDIIVGYPGETKKRFLNTKALFSELEFDLAYISCYSPRYGTASFNLKDNISLKEKKKRALDLENILKKTALKKNEIYLNKEVEVLVESIDKKGRPKGRTRTSKVVRILNADNCRKLIGEFVIVKINKVLEFELQGVLIK